MKNYPINRDFHKIIKSILIYNQAKWYSRFYHPNGLFCVLSSRSPCFAKTKSASLKSSSDEWKSSKCSTVEYKFSKIRRIRTLCWVCRSLQRTARTRSQRGSLPEEVGRQSANARQKDLDWRVPSSVQVGRKLSGSKRASQRDRNLDSSPSTQKWLLASSADGLGPDWVGTVPTRLEDFQIRQECSWDFERSGTTAKREVSQFGKNQRVWREVFRNGPDLKRDEMRQKVLGFVRSNIKILAIKRLR